MLPLVCAELTVNVKSMLSGDSTVGVITLVARFAMFASTILPKLDTLPLNVRLPSCEIVTVWLFADIDMSFVVPPAFIDTCVLPEITSPLSSYTSEPSPKNRELSTLAVLVVILPVTFALPVTVNKLDVGLNVKLALESKLSLVLN